MKLKLQRASLAVCLALPFSLLLVGCEKQTVSTDSNSVSARTNATSVEADNSARNVRDRNDATLTSGDQGATPSDREITTKVRRAVVNGTNDFSVSAQNVKIITLNGKVTLRGPVKTDVEKTGIVAIAKNVAGDGNVDDQLEVKNTL